MLACFVLEDILFVEERMRKKLLKERFDISPEMPTGCCLSDRIAVVSVFILIDLKSCLIFPTCYSLRLLYFLLGFHVIP